MQGLHPPAIVYSDVAMLRLTALILALAVQPVIGAEEWPLRFDAGPEWQIEYRGDGVDFFTLSRPKGENVFFVVSRWPSPGGREQIAQYIDKMARGLQEKSSGRATSLLMKGGYEIEEITGSEYSGQAAVFAMWDGTLQAMFMVSDGDGIWNGQFSGSRTLWREAKRVLGQLARPTRPLAIDRP